MLHKPGAALGRDRLNQMYRSLVVGVVASLLFGCTSPLTPSNQPAVQSETTPTSTAVYINAPVVRDPPIISIHMFDEENGWAVSQKQILRSAIILLFRFVLLLQLSAIRRL